MSAALQRLPLACPIDGLALHTVDRSFACERGHAYDVSRHGYVNLLPVQFKPSKDPGDDAAMVAARRRVLDAGLFDPLADAVAERVLACLGEPSTDSVDTEADERIDGDAPLLLDAGCGEGFYTDRMARRVRDDHRHGDIHVLGTDISVHAIKAAARRHDGIGWAVANNTHLPVVAGSPAVITSLFGFETWAPWSELQRAGQHVVVVHAGPRHLIELREAIYETVRIHDAPSADAATAAGYELEEERGMSFEVRPVTSERLADVLAMTPHGHRSRRTRPEFLAGADARTALPAGGPLTVHTVIRTFRRGR